MKITGGNFGIKGNAHISADNAIVIKADRSATYSAQQITSVAANSTKQRQFSVLSFLVGLLVLGIILGLLLNIIGVIIAVVIAVAGSFYSTKNTSATVTFDDGKILQLDCTARAVKKLVRLAPA